MLQFAFQLQVRLFNLMEVGKLLEFGLTHVVVGEHKCESLIRRQRLVRVLELRELPHKNLF